MRWLLFVVLSLTIIGTSVWAVQPLQTDDALTVPPYIYELEQVAYFSSAIQNATTTFTTGVNEKTDAGVQLQYLWHGTGIGLSSPAFETKWRFAGAEDSRNMASLALSAIFSRDAPPDYGASILFTNYGQNLITIVNIGRLWTLKRDVPDESGWGVGFLRSLSNKWILAAEATSNSFLSSGVLGATGPRRGLVGVIYNADPYTAYSAGISFAPAQPGGRWQVNFGVTVDY